MPMRRSSRERSLSSCRGRRRSRSRQPQLRADKDRGRVRSASPGYRGQAGPSLGRDTVSGQLKTVKKARKEIFAKELGYKNESNPFGDGTLTDKFVWRKKNEYLNAAGLYRKSSKEDEVQRIEYKIREIQQVKKRRDEREVERLLLEKQRQEHDKERHDEEFDEWLNKEEHFHLNNAKSRTLIRIEQGRERPLDLVSKALAIADGEEFDEMTILDKPPHQLFVPMSLNEVEELLPELETFIKNDTPHKAFWKAMLFVCNDAIDAKHREKMGAMQGGGMGAGVAEGVVTEIHELLSAKSKKELEDMLIEIKGSIQKGSEGLDTQFFDAVASKIPLFVARSEVESWHNRAKRKSDTWMEAHANQEVEKAINSLDLAEVQEPVSEVPQSGDKGDWDDLPDGPPADEEGLSPELEPLSVLEEQKGGGVSPVLEPLANHDPEDLLDPEEDERIMRQVRRTITDAFRDPASGGASGSHADGLDRSRDDVLLAAERARGMDQGEVGFNAKGKGIGDEVHGEVDLPQRHYEWEDKYRPRKPRFFNRVKTGFEWNKYNQTHYDHDNPPPKIVQGYKFNIFYPDLIDKTKAPTYHVEKGELPETCTLRFHAGPPYEDVAFKIVNREWNLSHRFGFRVVFDRGVLQLYFNFKRWRYRR